jgi:hypothetical protein
MAERVAGARDELGDGSAMTRVEFCRRHDVARARKDEAGWRRVDSIIVVCFISLCDLFRH